MAQPSVFDQGIDRVQETWKDIDREVRRVRRQLVRRRRSLERQLRSRRAELEKRAERQIRRLRTELRRYPAYKRAEEFQADARKRLDARIERVWTRIPIASRSEVEDLERKVARLTRRVRELEKSNGVGESA